MINLAQAPAAYTGFTLSPPQIAAFTIYEEELLEWNQRHNLTAIKDPEQIRVKHFLDSLSCLLIMRGRPMERVIDIGAGAGFPGLPLKIVVPNIQLTLVESVGKKVEFCQHIVQRLKLDSVEVIHSRAEDLGQDSAYREKFSWAIGRAVANMPVLAEYLLPFVRLGGAMLAMKGENAHLETQGALNALNILGGRLEKIQPVTLPGIAENRYLVVVTKIAATPPDYPRRAGIPAKKPL